MHLRVNNRPHMVIKAGGSYSTVGCRRRKNGLPENGLPESGLPKNSQAGISPKNKNDPRLENELRTVSPNANGICCEDDFSESAALLTSKRLHLDRSKNFSRFPDRLCVRPVHVQHRYRVPCTRHKLSSRDSKTDQKNYKKEIGWTRGK